MSEFRVQFLDRGGVIIREHKAEAASLGGVLNMLVAFEAPRVAIDIRVVDHLGKEIYIEAVGGRG